MNKQKITALIIQQDKDTSDSILKISLKHNLRLSVYSDTKQAFKTFQETKHNIVIINIEMPPESTLNLISQIRNHSKKTRCIVVSSNTDSQLLLRAIEIGVRGFHTMPIVDSKFNSLLAEVISEIQIEIDFETAEFKRLKAEREKIQSEQILEALSQATALFFRYGVSPSNIDKILKLIGKVSNSSRVNLFKNSEKSGKKFTGLVYTWARAKKFELVNKEQLREVPFEHQSISRWTGDMENRKNVLGKVADFADYERSMLEVNGVKSILSVPIYVDNTWWGFLSLDDCVEEKEWSNEEIRAMESVAYNLGAAIYRLKVERDMIRINESLENKIKERTAALEGEIAERMFADELLRDSEEKYRMIYENAINGILLIQDQKIILTSPSMVEMMERIPNLLIGKPFCDFIVKDQVKEVASYFQDSARKDIGDLRVEVLIPNKESKWLELKTTRISWDNRPAFLIFTKDISLQTKAENELIDVNKSLEKRIKKEISKVKKQQLLLMQKSKLESLGELSAGLAHEINQPLLGISMGLDNILLSTHSEGFSRPYIKSKVELLFKDIDRIKQIIEHVRTFSRSQQSIQHENVEINKLVRDALTLSKKMLQNQKIKLEIEYAQNDVLVMGNPYRIEQVILNLLSNAMHAVNERHKHASWKVPGKLIGLKILQKGSFVLIKIMDNGIGIPYDVLPNIFDPFFTTKNEEKGTGLGLSISYGIIEEMNGNILVDSVENEYTTATIKLPLYNK